MANLIIKSSADNLVLQGSDASPAITVGTDGTTTFAENATMSGVTTLANATITAGTFPAGHVIKIEKGFLDTVTSSTSTTSPGTTSGLSVGITPASSSSKIFLQVSLGMAAGAGSSLAFDIYSSLTSGILGVGNVTGRTNAVGTLVRAAPKYNGDTNHGAGTSFSYHDAPSTWSSGEITYTVYMWGETSPTYLNRSSNDADVAAAYGARTSSTITATEYV